MVKTFLNIYDNPKPSHAKTGCYSKNKTKIGMAQLPVWLVCFIHHLELAE